MRFDASRESNVRRGPSLRWIAVVLAAVLIAAACGDDSGSDADGEASAPRADPNGVLRYAVDMAQSAPVTFDPVRSLSQTNEPYLFMVYDSLLRKRPNGDLVPGLAQSATVIDPSTIEVKLRPNVAFTDGTGLDAAAARASIMAIRSTADARCCRAEYKLLLDVEVVNPTTFRLKLDGTSAGAYYPLLAGTETMIVSPAARAAGKDLTKEAAGAGPFTLEQIVDGQRIVFRRSPTHWDAENVKLGGVEAVAISAGAQQQTALRAGQVNMIAIAGGDVAQLEGTFGIYERTDSSSTLQIPVCKTRKPLDDVRVRRALNHATDLEAINDVLLAGKGAPMEALFTKDSKFFPKSLDGLYDYDPEKAKSLLKEAGVAPGTEIGIVTIGGNQTSTRWAEILQGQWQKVGIQLRITPSSNVVQDFFSGSPREPLMTLPFTRSGISKVTSRYIGTASGNVCQYDDPELNRLVARLSGVAEESPEGVELWHEIQELIFEQSLSLWGLFNPVIWAHDEALADVGVITSTILYPDFLSTYVKRA